MLTCLRCVFNAVAAVTQGFLHKDLKPDNILMQTLTDGTNLIRITDFGLATPVQVCVCTCCQQALLGQKSVPGIGIWIPGTHNNLFCYCP
jgi:serine/threonine protein kinase